MKGDYDQHYRTSFNKLLSWYVWSLISWQFICLSGSSKISSSKPQGVGDGSWILIKPIIALFWSVWDFPFGKYEIKYHYDLVSFLLITKASIGEVKVIYINFNHCLQQVQNLESVGACYQLLGWSFVQTFIFLQLLFGQFASMLWIFRWYPPKVSSTHAFECGRNFMFVSSTSDWYSKCDFNFGKKNISKLETKYSISINIPTGLLLLFRCVLLISKLAFIYFRNHTFHSHVWILSRHVSG